MNRKRLFIDGADLSVMAVCAWQKLKNYTPYYFLPKQINLVASSELETRFFGKTEKVFLMMAEYSLYADLFIVNDCISKSFLEES